MRWRKGYKRKVETSVTVGREVMSEEKEEMRKKTSRVDLNSKFWRISLVVLAAALTFAGPTYVIYVLSRINSVGLVAATITGFGLFVVGLVLSWYLIRNKVLS
jgi:anti-sigma-K factor RskA